MLRMHHALFPPRRIAYWYIMGEKQINEKSNEHEWDRLGRNEALPFISFSMCVQSTIQKVLQVYPNLKLPFPYLVVVVGVVVGVIVGVGIVVIVVVAIDEEKRVRMK